MMTNEIRQAIERWIDAGEQLQEHAHLSLTDGRYWQLHDQWIAAFRDLLAVRFPGQRWTIPSRANSVYAIATFPSPDGIGQEEVVIRCSDHLRTSRDHLDPAANLVIGMDAADIEVELDAAEEAIRELQAQ